MITLSVARGLTGKQWVMAAPADEYNEHILYNDNFYRVSEKTDSSIILDMDCKEASLGCRICDFSTTNAKAWAMHFDIQEPSKSACIIGLERKR